MIKQVRTKNNSFSTVRYDKDGNILTPSRLKALRKAKKESNKCSNSNLVQCKENYKKLVRNKIFVGFKKHK